jgi:hypothetical protein
MVAFTPWHVHADVISLTSDTELPPLKSLESALSEQNKTLSGQDDLMLSGKFQADSKTEIICANLEIRSIDDNAKNLGALFLQTSSLTVDGKITLETAVLAKNLGGLTFHSMLLGKSGVLEVMINPSQVTGESLECANGSSLVFKLFNHAGVTYLQAPAQCAVVLSETATFGERMKLVLHFLKDAASPVIAPGEYVLLRAKEISGAVPELVVKDDEEIVEDSKYSLKCEDGQLLLVVQ